MSQKVLRFLVLAGRPVGGTEGMVLQRLPVSDGALKAFGTSGEGVAAVLSCMERHQSHAGIQAMACWSMVNLALVADQKRALVREGGISAIVKAMARHPEDSEVHFRAMFALINLVTPDVTADSSIPTETMQVRQTQRIEHEPFFRHVHLPRLLAYRLLIHALDILITCSFIASVGLSTAYPYAWHFKNENNHRSVNV